MRIIEIIIEAADPKGVNTVVGNHIEDPNIGEGEAKIIITMAITEAEVVVAVVETISDPTVMGEAIFNAIIITNTTNITHMMMVHRLNNMAHHAHFAVVSTILLNIALKENMTSIIS